MAILASILLSIIILTACVSAPLAFIILANSRDTASLYVGTLLLIYPTIVYFKILSTVINQSRNTLTETIASQLLKSRKDG